MSIRLFGAGIVLSSSWTIGGNLTLYRGGASYSANFSTTMPAGVYDFFSFNAKFSSVVRQALITNKHASITAPALDSVLFKTVFPSAWSSTPNANQLTFTFDPTGFVVTAGALQTTVQSFTINNSTGAKVWTLLGMVSESGADSSAGTVNYSPASPNATLVTFTGQFQSRAIFCFEDSVRDTWDNEVRPLEATLQLRDGTVKRWSMGSPESYREITLVDLTAPITGPPLEMCQWSSFGASRLVLNLWAPNIAQFTNVTNISTNGTLAAGEIVQIGSDQWWSRVSTATSTVVNTREYWPTSITPTAGDSIWRISEAGALWIEAIRTNYLFVFEPDQSSATSSRFKPLAYKLNLNGRHELNFSRLDQYLSLYSVVFPLTRANTPGTVVV